MHIHAYYIYTERNMYILYQNPNVLLFQRIF